MVRIEAADFLDARLREKVQDIRACSAEPNYRYDLVLELLSRFLDFGAASKRVVNFEDSVRDYFFNSTECQSVRVMFLDSRATDDGYVALNLFKEVGELAAGRFV